MATTLDRQTLLPLLASSLDGTQDSLLVLADLLEEAGSDEIADRARTQELRLQKQLRFVIQLAPKELLLRLGCDYLTHIVDRSAEVYEPYLEARRQLKVIREWDWENSSLDTLTLASERLAGEIVTPIRSYWSGYETHILAAFFRLIEATDQKVAARKEALAGSGRDEHVTGRARSLINKAATAARNQPGDVRPRTQEELQSHRNAIRHVARLNAEISESALASASSLHLIDWQFGVADVATELQWQAEQTGRVLLDSLS